MSVYFFFFSLCFFLIGMSMFKENLFMLLEWEMYSLNSLSVIFPLILDYKCMMFLGTVFLISSMVIIYSNSYMASDLNQLRFLFTLLLFIFSMMFLILSPCLVSILLGWDGLGLTSYCLVVFYQNQKSSNSGMITALTNRIGDVLILLSIGIMSSLGSWNFILLYTFDWEHKYLLCILICLASMTKSSQIPFSAWLPAAMAAPTPVSSLVHSSTLVTAGVYLLIRFSSFLLEEDLLSFLLALVGSSTMVMSGISANIQFDLKKIIALSTLSQLGVMFTSLSLGMIDLCFFHLLTHAMFKSLLFMCAGMLIHCNMNNQDIRLFGDSSKFFPLTLIFFNTANLALCGMPFLAGFYSKDVILEMVCFSTTNWLIFFMFFFATGLTVCYTVRLIFLTMTFKFNYMLKVLNLNDNCFDMTFSMCMMFFCSIFMGKLGSFLFLVNPCNFIVLPLMLKFLTLLVCLMGSISGYIISKDLSGKIIPSFNIFMEWSNFMWFLSLISPSYMKKFSLNLGNKVCKLSTSGWVEETLGENLIFLSYEMFLWYLKIISDRNFLLGVMSFSFSISLMIFLIF